MRDSLNAIANNAELENTGPKLQGWKCGDKDIAITALYTFAYINYSKNKYFYSPNIIRPKSNVIGLNGKIYKKASIR